MKTSTRIIFLLTLVLLFFTLVLTILSKALASNDYSSILNKFVDVDKIPTIHQDALQRNVDRGLFQGTYDNKFLPTSPIIRQDLSLVFDRFYQTEIDNIYNEMNNIDDVCSKYTDKKVKDAKYQIDLVQQELFKLRERVNNSIYSKNLLDENSLQEYTIIGLKKNFKESNN